MFITGQFECYGTIELRQAWLLPIKILKLSSNIVKTLSTLQFFYDCSTLLELPNSTAPWKFQYIRLLIWTEMWKKQSSSLHMYMYPPWVNILLLITWHFWKHIVIVIIYEHDFSKNFFVQLSFHESCWIFELFGTCSRITDHLWLKFFDLLWFSIY